MTRPEVPTSLDIEALEELEGASSDRIATIRRRAEKWIPALTTLSGLVTAVLIVKGPESITELQRNWQIAVGAAFGLGLVFFAASTFFAYSAAFGSADTRDFEPRTTTGLHARLLRRRIRDEKGAIEALRSATQLAYLGVAALAIGVAFTWFGPQPSSDAAKTLCITDAAGNSAQLSGDSVTVSEVKGMTIGACP